MTGPLDAVTLRNAHGATATILPLGGILRALTMPDRHGRLANVVLGLNRPEDYFTQSVYFGCITGRYANRIAHARFTLDGTTYRLHATDGTSHVHGGRRGFDKAIWSVRHVDHGTVALHYRSPDGEEGFPGTLDTTVTYTLTDAQELRIDYAATTDAPTIVNLTNHSYFNLAGEGSGDVLGHVLTIAAERYTQADAILIPTGEFSPVAGTPFDFRTPTPIGARIREPHPLLVAGRGYDLNYVLDNSAPGNLVFAARVLEPVSGRTMDVHSTEPGLQLYTGNLLDGTLVGTGGTLYRQSDGFCLETHHFPDSPNRPEFPSVVLRPGEAFASTTVYRFGVQER